MKALPPHTRLILASEDLLERMGTRDYLGHRITADWGKELPGGWYEPTFTVHYDQTLADELQVALNGFLWLGNNLANIEAAPVTFRELFEAALSDARKVIPAPIELGGKR